MIDLKTETPIRLWPEAARHLPPGRKGRIRSKSSMYRLKEQGLEVCIISGVLYTSIEALHRLIERQTNEQLAPVREKHSEKRRVAQKERAKRRLKGHGINENK
jgi:hypothetical protein